MKKHTQKWKELNKNGLKLSLFCGLNWLVKFLGYTTIYCESFDFLSHAQVLNRCHLYALLKRVETYEDDFQFCFNLSIFPRRK